MAETLCFYCGAPNVSRFIDPEAYIQLDEKWVGCGRRDHEERDSEWGVGEEATCHQEGQAQDSDRDEHVVGCDLRGQSRQNNMTLSN